LKDQELQLIQSYEIQNADDILYYVLAVANQSGLSALQTQLELSGLVDLHPELMEQLKKSFGILSFDLVNNQDAILTKPSNFSPYFLTPFYKLMV